MTERVWNRRSFHTLAQEGYSLKSCAEDAQDKIAELQIMSRNLYQVFYFSGLPADLIQDCFTYMEAVAELERTDHYAINVAESMARKGWTELKYWGWETTNLVPTCGEIEINSWTESKRDLLEDYGTFSLARSVDTLKTTPLLLLVKQPDILEEQLNSSLDGSDIDEIKNCIRPRRSADDDKTLILRDFFYT